MDVTTQLVSEMFFLIFNYVYVLCVFSYLFSKSSLTCLARSARKNFKDFDTIDSYKNTAQFLNNLLIHRFFCKNWSSEMLDFHLSNIVFFPSPSLSSSLSPFIFLLWLELPVQSWMTVNWNNGLLWIALDSNSNHS